jgi:hypothetical protein
MLMKQLERLLRSAPAMQPCAKEVGGLTNRGVVLSVLCLLLQCVKKPS